MGGSAHDITETEVHLGGMQIVTILTIGAAAHVLSSGGKDDEV